MCKEELNEEMELENETTSMEDLSKEELLKVIEYLQEMPKLDLEDLMNMNEFQEGIKSMAKVCGQVVALNTVNVDSNTIADIILNEANIQYNLKLNEMTCSSNEKVARLQEVKVEQSQI